MASPADHPWVQRLTLVAKTRDSLRDGLAAEFHGVQRGYDAGKRKIVQARLARTGTPRGPHRGSRLGRLLLQALFIAARARADPHEAGVSRHAGPSLGHCSSLRLGGCAGASAGRAFCATRYTI